MKRPNSIRDLVEKMQRKQVCQVRLSPAKWDALEFTIIAFMDIRMSS